MGTGDFIWYDLLTADTASAIAFYAHVVGWTTQDFPGAKGHYTMWVGSQGPLGGVMTLPEEAAKMGAPPHWMANVTITDLDASVARVKALGGKVYKEPEAIPTVGRFAVIADPQGAVLSLFQPEREMQAHDTTKAGEVCWNELATTDHEAALRFYSELFGWSLMESMDMGPMGSYLIYGKGGAPLGGMFRKPAEMPVAAWVYYVHVDGLDAAIERATSRGAKLVHGPVEVPGGDRIAQLTDPQGAFFALHGAKKS